MADISMRTSGRVVINGDGSAREDKFSLRASMPICNNSGRVTLHVHPSFRPDLSVDKNGLSHNMAIGNIADLAVVDNVDVEVQKDNVNILGRDCNVNAHWNNVNRNPTGKVSITTNVDKIGDVTLLLGKRGDNSVLPEEEPLGSDTVKVSAALPIADMIGNKDVSAQLDYDLANDEAKLHLGYKSGDIGARVESSFNVRNSNMAHKLALSYSGIDGITISGDINDQVSGKACINKDNYELRVPVNKGGVNVNDVSIRMTWSQDL